MKPRSPQRLPGGHTLITDADAQTCERGRPRGHIVWRFGVAGQAGMPQQGRLRDPTYAERLADGTTLIADSGNGLVVRVDAQGVVVACHDMAKLDPPGGPSNTDPPAPRMATPAADGSLLVADSGFARFIEIGLPAQATITSQPLEMGTAARASGSSAWRGRERRRAPAACGSSTASTAAAGSRARPEALGARRGQAAPVPRHAE